MNIIMSLIPPKLMKLANLFGFHGNRRVGLQALEFASNSQDMKAPLARYKCMVGRRERGPERERERERKRERGAVGERERQRKVHVHVQCMCRLRL